MSQIENVITTTFRARGSQAIAEMRGYAGSIGQVGRVINDTTRMSERLNNQWRAIGTTIRYAVAGGAIFGLTRMVTQLKDVQTQLGLIQAIGQPAGGGSMSTSAVNRLGNDLQKASLRALTPINEINDATINLLSTVQNVPQSEIPGIIGDIAIAAKIAQTPVEDLTKAATTMNIAFGRPNNRNTLGQFNRMWATLIQEAPGGISAAPQIATQLPQLASMFALGKGPVSGAQSQRQMLAMVLGVLRTGSNPSTGLRGLTYLAQSIIQPTGKARGALAAIGITPQSIEKEGINTNIMRLLNTVTKTGNTKQLAGMPDDTLNALDESGGNLPGIPAAEMSRLRQMIPRIHGIRAAVILAGQLRQQGQVKSLEQDLTLFEQAQKDQADQTHSLARMWTDFKNRSQLQAASVALNTLKLQMAQALEPIINFAAGGITGLSGLAQHHRTATKAAVLGGAAIVGALGVGRFLGVGRSGNALVRANAIQAAMTPGGVLGDSPQNPLYVVVVGNLFNGSTTPPGTTPGGGGGAKGKFGRLGRKALPYLETLAIAEGGGAVVGAGALTAGIVAPLAILGAAAYYGRNDRGPNQSALQKVMDANRQRNLPGSMIPGEGAKKGIFYGQFDVTVNHPDGTKTSKRIHVPLDLMSPGIFPSARGQAGKTARKN